MEDAESKRQNGDFGLDQKPKEPNRKIAIQRHALAMIERGERVTMQAIRVFLASRSKPYSLKADQISFALKPLRDQKKVDSFTNGKRVKVDKKTYHSIRQAAREEGVAIETVRKRIRSESPEFKLWHYAD